MVLENKKETDKGAKAAEHLHAIKGEVKREAKGEAHKDSGDIAEDEKTGGYDQKEHTAHTRYLAILKQEFQDRYSSSYSDTKLISDYDLIKTLGVGAFATVFLVRDKDTLEMFAMKAIEKRLIVEKKLVKQLHSERKIMQSIHFPFVLNSVSLCKDNVYIYFVMPLVQGGELFTLIRRLGVLEEKCATFYAAQIVLGLEYLHHCCVIHRDLKPENIFIDDNGYAKLGDYGFAKMISKKNRTWTLCGTPEYIAPEIITCKGYSYSVDWWALGILIFEMICGYPPFYHPDPVALYEKIMTGYFKAPPTMTGNSKSIVKHLLNPDPTKRFGSLKSGVYDIKAHKWFASTVWSDILVKRVKPPFVPTVKVVGEGEMFGNETEAILKRASKCLYKEEFEGF